VALIEKIKLDDPVGAVAVHLICGIWGTLAVGIFGAMASLDQFLIQLAGVAAAAAFCSVTAFVTLYAVKKLSGIRVSELEEIEGLDLHEHGMDAYADFRMNQH
jgi:Amt family ammonium transporter